MIQSIKLVYNVLRARVKKKPYKINFTVTSFCNSKCITCNIWQNPISKEELTIDEIGKIFDNLPDTVCWLSLTGGEPFSRKDFSDIILLAIKKIPNLALIGIPTNGLYQSRILETAEQIMKIKNHPRIIITSSIDGPCEVHDYVRGIKGSFEKTWETYSKLKKLTMQDKNFTAGIETTVSNKNVDKIYSFLETLLKEKHRVTLTFAHEAYLYQNVSGQGPLGIVPVNIGEIERIVSLFMKKFRFWSPQDIIEKNYLKKVANYLAKPSEKVVPCMSLITTMSINAFGKVTPCLMWGKQIGNLRETNHDISKIYNSQVSDETRKQIKENNCPNCWTPCEAYQSILWDKLRIYRSK